MKTIKVDPNSRLDYVANWEDWLSGDDTIYDSSWDVQPEGELIVPPGSESFTDTVAKCYLTVDVDPESVLGKTYIVTNSIETDAGLEDDRSFRVRIKNT